MRGALWSGTMTKTLQTGDRVRITRITAPKGNSAKYKAPKGTTVEGIVKLYGTKGGFHLQACFYTYPDGQTGVRGTTIGWNVNDSAWAIEVLG